MRVYLDLCALKRPYDKPVQERILLEALAVAAIKAFEHRRLDLISSTALELENEKNPQEDRRVEVADVLRSIPTTVRTEASRAVAQLLVAVVDPLTLAARLDSEGGP